MLAEIWRELRASLTDLLYLPNLYRFGPKKIIRNRSFIFARTLTFFKVTLKEICNNGRYSVFAVKPVRDPFHLGTLAGRTFTAAHHFSFSAATSRDDLVPLPPPSRRFAAARRRARLFPQPPHRLELGRRRSGPPPPLEVISCHIRHFS
jgi:hypothetical protein